MGGERGVCSRRTAIAGPKIHPRLTSSLSFGMHFDSECKTRSCHLISSRERERQLKASLPVCSIFLELYDGDPHDGRPFDFRVREWRLDKGRNATRRLA